MAQNFWTAIWAWGVCFVVTIVVSLVTSPRPQEELTGLVYSLTPQIQERQTSWYRRPLWIGVGVVILLIILNAIFW